MSEGQVALVAFGGAAVLLFWNLTNKAYAKAYLDWLSMRDPFGWTLWRDHTLRHVSPFLFVFCVFLVGQVIQG
ncbi:hypothetical protein [Gymnodinialimonas hymeniacidonis]|uniref:hypothetical protein n=1 Tax=Gymnodinialimonas hymeniacidonis TaxID=3126508 RepID=UPI0034C659CF